MVAKYYVAVRPRTNEDHAVHKEDCPFLQDGEKKIYLGVFRSGKDAEREGQRHFIRSKSCPFCSGKHVNHDDHHPPHPHAITVEKFIPLSGYQYLVCGLN